MTNEASAAAAGGRPGRLIRPKRDRGLRDILVYPKSRKLIVYWAPVLTVLVFFAVRGAQSGWTLFFGALFGILVYSLIEYLSHRFLYHWEPESRFVRIITGDVGRQHMRHHREPEKYSGAINGNQLPIVAFALLLSLAAWLTPFPTAFGLIAIAAGAANYVAQEFVHFCTHFLPMKSGFGAMMKRHHMLHHYRDGDTNFGLFWPFWDMILGTHYDSIVRRRR